MQAPTMLAISFIDAANRSRSRPLKESGQWDNTIVVLTSDHGYLTRGEIHVGKVIVVRKTVAAVPW